MPRSEGRAKWTPARNLETENHNDDTGLRWCRNDSLNIDRKIKEGWVFVNNTTGAKADHGMEENKVTGAKQHKELILMEMTNEDRAARTKYYSDITDRRTKSLAEEVKNKAAAMGGSIDGKIVIE